MQPPRPRITIRIVLIAIRASLVFAIQTWLAETPEQTRNAGTPSYLSVGMSSTEQFLT